MYQVAAQTGFPYNHGEMRTSILFVTSFSLLAQAQQPVQLTEGEPVPGSAGPSAVEKREEGHDREDVVGAKAA